MPNATSQLIDLLQKKGSLTKENLAKAERAAAATGRAIEKVLIEEKLVPETAFAQTKAELLNIPFVDLKTSSSDPEAMQGISRSAAATHRFVAFKRSENTLHVAMESPENIQSVEAVRFITRKQGLTPKIYLTTRSAIDTVLGGKQEAEAVITSALEDFNHEVELSSTIGQDAKSISTFIEDAPVTKVVAVIIRHAIEGAASDIHIEPDAQNLEVRYRIDGRLRTSLNLPRKIHSAVISRIKILANLKIDETRLPQDGRFSTAVEDKSYDFRVASMPTVYGEKIVLRILDKSTGAPTLQELGLVGPSAQTFSDYLKSPHGILLISGPTGSGKSTTLFSALSQINKPDVNIVTLEDPVEYEIEGANQTQVRPDIGFTFATGLRSVLRQDPNIIMVGEIRDKETAELTVHASLTGHLVLTTIHTNSALGTIPRLNDLGVDPFLLVASLRLLVAQRLVAHLCQSCKQEVPMDEKTKERLEIELHSVPDKFKTDPNQKDPKHLYKSPGCPVCKEQGTDGRIGIFEVVPITSKIRTAVNDPLKYDTLATIARELGYPSLRQDGLLKSLVGEVAYEDVLRATADGEDS